jgi:hypothetical protein
LLILLALTSLAYAQKPPDVKVGVTFTRAYCGGAKPTQEILDELNQERPLANCKLVFFSTTTKKKYTVRTNENGQAVLKKFIPGTYKVFIASNRKNKATLPFNKACTKLSKISLTEATVKTDGDKVNLRIPCDPCDADMKKRP